MRNTALQGLFHALNFISLRSPLSIVFRGLIAPMTRDPSINRRILTVNVSHEQLEVRRASHCTRVQWPGPWPHLASQNGLYIGFGAFGVRPIWAPSGESELAYSTPFGARHGEIAL